MRPDAGYWIEKLGLTRHVEGGAFKEVYRSPLTLSKNILPEGFRNDRNICTSIYFLLEQGQFSAFHRIASDELWHFYYGDPLIVYEFDSKGSLIEHQLGPEFDKGQRFQALIKAGNWFGSRPARGSKYSLVGCTVAPGFDFEDFELAQRQSLCEIYPAHASLITQMTY